MKATIKAILLVLAILPAVCLADVITLKSSAPQTYVVKKGDTLWDIAGMYLDQPWQWPELWRNNTQITNPHLIYPGDELRLRFDEQGEPVLEIVREPAKPTLKLSPEGKRVQKDQVPIATLPWSAIQPYVERDLLMDETEYQRLPHLLGNQAGAVRFASGDVVLSNKTRRSHKHFYVVRKQDEVYDKFDNLLGIQIRHVADAKPLKTDLKKQILVKVEQANFEAKRGDKLLPAASKKLDQLTLEAADNQRGEIVASLEQHQLLGKFDVVIIDQGEGDVVPGTVMGIYHQGPTIIDGEEPLYTTENNYLKSAFDVDQEIEQPAQKIGELVVFKTFSKASYALITRSSGIVKKGAIVAKP